MAFLLVVGPKFGSKNAVFGLFRAKMTTIGIQNPKLIVTNDYQQFLAHFDWFLSLFQIFISDSVGLVDQARTSFRWLILYIDRSGDSQ